MYRIVPVVIVISLLGWSLFSSHGEKEDWGFFGHKEINRHAVFTLPQEMIVFYKKHIEYITEHAVDPDKRRYATKHEAHRHYIDLDMWGSYPYEEMPRKWTDALAKYTDIYAVTAENDTLLLIGNEVMSVDKYKMTLRSPDIAKAFKKDTVVVYNSGYLAFFEAHIKPKYYEDDKIIDCDLLKEIFLNQPLHLDCVSAFAVDRLSEHGVLPWNLQHMQFRLTKAFQEKNVEKIIRLSADMGHYVGDAHVPLHTTKNYNGQLTNQAGIHGFWESRLVELYSDEYDYFVGKAEYVDYPQDFFWKTVLASNRLVDSVLSIEKRLSLNFPQDKQFCYEERLDRTIRTQCEGYCRAFHNELKGMVEDRFTASIHSLGSLWYTAWVDAGQPDLYELAKDDVKGNEEEEEELEKKFKDGKIKGREHGASK